MAADVGYFVLTPNDGEPTAGERNGRLDWMQTLRDTGQEGKPATWECL